MTEKPSPSPAPEGSTDRELLRSLHRLEGHVRGVAGMVEREEAYDDVLVQLMALRSAVNRIIALYLTRGLEEALPSSEDSEEPLQQGLERLKRSLALVLKHS